jgi:hypothetical protein
VLVHLASERREVISLHPLPRVPSGLLTPE